jgi:hypothetical protein
MTERLKMVVDWINGNYERENIKFVVVDGDISDTAEYSEFLKAREILNQLKIPYIPLIGNHDIWPNTQKLTTDPDGLGGRWNTIKEKRKEGEPLGDEYFEKIFWQDNATNTSRIKALFDNFERQEEIPQYQGPPYFQNYSFNFGGTTFIALDFNARDYDELIPMGCTTVRVWDETLNWLEEKLKENQGKKIIIFVHQPLVVELYLSKLKFEIEPIIQKYCKCGTEECNCKTYIFAGHTHCTHIAKWWEMSPSESIETEALLQPSVSIPPKRCSGSFGQFIRIIQITGGNPSDIDYGTFATGFPQAINPYFITNREEVAAGEKIKFIAKTKNLKPEEILSYTWDFDRNYFAQCERKENQHSQCIVTYSQPGSYRVSLKVIPKNNSDYYEEIFWDVKIKQETKPRWKIFLPIPKLLPLLNGEENIVLTEEENAQNTEGFTLISKEIGSPIIPIGGVNIHFEKANQDINLSKLIADSDLKNRKSILYMKEWPDVIEKSKVLFIPK